MSLLNLIGISDAVAAAGQPQSLQGSLMQLLPMLILFAAVFYFLLIRPQQKRQREQRELMNNLNKGEEVITNGGILGKIVSLRDDFVVLAIAEGVEITLQKSSIHSVLPKGTLRSVK